MLADAQVVPDALVVAWADAAGRHALPVFLALLFALLIVTAAAAWAVQAGTALSARVRAGVPNSVNLVRWAGPVPAGLCVVEQWDHAAQQQAFVRARVTELTPARGAHAG